MPRQKKPDAKPKRTSPEKEATPKRPTRTLDPEKVEKFVNKKAAGVPGAQAVREAGWEQSPDAAAVTASRLLSRDDIRARVEERRQEALRRAGMETDVIIGALAEIATASVGDVLEDDGSFDLQKCRERGVDHLLKELERTERTDKDGARTVTYKYKMYDRLNAINQLRDTYGMKEEPRPNSLDERRRREVKASIDRIMERDGVDGQTAAQMLLASLKGIPNTEETIKIVSEHLS